MVLSGSASALAALLLAAPLAMEGGPATPGAPSPARLAQLSSRFEPASLVRVETRRSFRFAGRVRLDSDAVVVPGPRRVALVEIGSPPEKRDVRIPWTEVESLSIGRSRTGLGLFVGATFGALVAGTLIRSYGVDLEQNDPVVYYAVGAGLACAGLGAILGAANPEWTRVYP